MRLRAYLRVRGVVGERAGARARSGGGARALVHRRVGLGDLLHLLEARVDARHQVGRALGAHRVDRLLRPRLPRRVAPRPLEERLRAVRVRDDRDEVVVLERGDEGVRRVLRDVELRPAVRDAVAVVVRHLGRRVHAARDVNHEAVRALGRADPAVLRLRRGDFEHGEVSVGDKFHGCRCEGAILCDVFCRSAQESQKSLRSEVFACARSSTMHARDAEEK